MEDFREGFREDFRRTFDGPLELKLSVLLRRYSDDGVRHIFRRKRLRKLMLRSKFSVCLSCLSSSLDVDSNTISSSILKSLSVVDEVAPTSQRVICNQSKIVVSKKTVFKTYLKFLKDREQYGTSKIRQSKRVL